MRNALERNALPALLLLGLGVRIIGIATRPIWYDEAFSVLFSEKGFGAMLIGTLSSTAQAAADIHPLTYYTLLWAWMRIFGESLTAVRGLSVITGLAVIFVVYLLALELINRRTALVATFITALSPFQVHYSEELRMYTLLTLWLLLATYAYLRASRSTGWKWWGAFAVFAALAQYTHNLAAFYLASVALWPLLTKNWRILKAVTLSGLGALILYSPWLIHLPAQFAKVGQIYWIEKPGLYRVLTLLLVFVTNLPIPNELLAVALFLALAVVLIALWQTFLVAQRSQDNLQAGLWLLYLSFAPAILLFLFSQWKPIYLERALLPSGAVFCIWLVWALLETGLARPMQLLVSVLLVVAFSLGIYEHVTYTGFPYAPYSDMTKNLHANLQPGDVIIHSNKLSMFPSAYYDRLLPQTYIADAAGSPEDTLARRTQEVLGLEAQPNLEAAAGDARRVWFIIFRTSDQEYVAAGYPRHPQLTWLMQHYSQVDVQNWGDLRAYLFVRRP